MSTTCTRCQNTGFINVEQIPNETRLAIDLADDRVAAIQGWISLQTEPHDVQVCDCCGNGEVWYGTPGEHYGPDDLPGRGGPYQYNGGLCECH